MAKKKSKSAKLNIKAIIAIVVGLAIFGLAFIPATKVVVDLGVLGKSESVYNFYTLIGKAFAEDAATELVLMGVFDLITLIFAGLTVVLGVLMLLGVLNKKSDMLAVIALLVIAAALIGYIICFFIWKGSVTTLDFGSLGTITLGDSAKISTFVYFLLGVDLVGLAGYFLVK